MSVLFVGLIAACSNPWEQAKQKNTVAGYQDFIFAFPNDPNVPEAKKREAELAYKKLGESPTEEQLASYLQAYPASPYRAQVKGLLIEARLAQWIREAHLSKISRFREDSEDEALRLKAKEALDYYAGSKTAFRTLDASFFEDYLRLNPGGDFSENATWSKDRIKLITQARPKRMPVVLDGDFATMTREQIEDTFARRRLRTKFVDDLLGAGLKEGQVGYHFIRFEAGVSSQIFSNAGDLISVTAPRTGVGVQILAKDQDSGKLKPVWTLAADDSMGLESIDFPVINWNARLAILAAEDFGSGLGQVAELGNKYLVLATVDGFLVYDPSLPTKLRLVASFVRPNDTAADLKANVKTSGHLVALYGEGLDLVNCRKLGQVETLISIPFAKTGRIVSATFIGEYFYYASNLGLFVIHPSWDQPKPLGSSRFTHITRFKDKLIAAGKDDIGLYLTRRDGTLGAKDSVDPRAFYAIAETGGIEPVDSWSTGDSVVFVTDAGSVFELKNRHIRSRTFDSGDAFALAGSRDRMISLGIRGLSLLKRTKNGWSWVASVPLSGCINMVYRPPYAYVSCGTSLGTIHVGALER